MQLRNSLLISFVACVLVSCPAMGQVPDRAVLNSTVWVTYDVPGTSAADTNPSGGSAAKPAHPASGSTFGGTGFLIFNGVGYTKGQVYLITNKHVLPPEGKQQDIHIRVVVRDKDRNAKVDNVSVPVVGTDGKYLDSVRVHPDPDTDVAAVNIAPAAFGSKFQLLIDAITTHKYLDMSMLMTTEKLRMSEIGLGSQVYIVGFPAAIFDPRNVSPILRVGIMSTDPRDGFNFNEALRRGMQFPEHLNGFLVDANVYPGSSGSLVVLAPDLTKRTSGNSNTDWPPTILGIVAGSIPFFDASLRSYERIGLGIVYSADSIKDVLDAFNRPHRK